MAKNDIDQLEENSLLEKLSKQLEDFLTEKDHMLREAERDRAYVDHFQWNAEDTQALENRGQAPVVINRIKKKVNFLIGLNESTATDPKAFPRTPEHEKGAEAITDALRFVADNNDFDDTDSNVFEDRIVWGYGGAIVRVEDVNDEKVVQVEHISADRYYFDVNSRRRDFKDNEANGIVIWMSEEGVKTTYPDKAGQIDLMTSDGDFVSGTTFEDVPMNWVDKTRKRIRVCEVYFKQDGVWMMAHFTKQMFLIDPIESPALDEFDNPENPIEFQSAYVDKDTNRYGEVRADIWIQDEINHRRSKALHLLSVRQTVAKEGSIDDIAEMKRELSKPAGHVEVQGEIDDFEILPTGDMAQGQFALLQEAKSEIETGEPDITQGGEDESGRAKQLRQQAGLTGKGRIFKDQTRWKRRIYRQIHNRIKQHWTAEKWIRVTDDADNLRFVGLNQKRTKGEVLFEKAQEGDQRAVQVLQTIAQEIQAQAQTAGRQIEGQELEQAIFADSRLQETVVENNVQELDVDIILLETQESATIQQEQFEVISRLAQTYGAENVPFDLVLELSDLRGKARVLERLQNKQEEDPQRQQAVAINLAEKQADIESTQADTQKTLQEAQGEAIENQLLIRGPVNSVVAIT